jgi:hypothetical protein
MKEWEKHLVNIEEFNKEYFKSSVELNNALVYFELIASKLSPVSQDIESTRDFSDQLTKKRFELINGVVAVFIDACNNNMWQRIATDLGYGSGNYFEHYLSYFTPQEKTAQTGNKLVESVAFKMVEKIADDGSISGDEMYGHLVLPIEFVYEANSGKADISTWLEGVPHDGVYLKYYYEKSKNILPVEYKITDDNVSIFKMHNNIYESIDGTEPIIVDGIDLEKEYVESSIAEAKIVADLLNKLAAMKLYKIKTQE